MRRAVMVATGNNQAANFSRPSLDAHASYKGPGVARVIAIVLAAAGALSVADTFAAELVAGPAGAKLLTQTRFNIPAQPLGLSLKQLADQAGIQILFEERVVAGLQAPEVKAEQTARQALEALLSGTGLEYTAKDETVAVRLAGKKGKGKTQTTRVNDKSPALRLAQADNVNAGNANVAAGGAAASQVDKDTGAAGSAGGLEEIIVTAQKRSERAIDIPMSITVIGVEDLERKGIADMGDLAYAAPGMMVQEFGPGRQVIFMRGVGNRVGTSALTGVYLDEVPVTAGTSQPQSIGQLDLRTTDLERVEVLKGPQGTLYGAGAVSGTVRFITAAPKLDVFTARGDATASFTEDGDPSQKISAVLNIPVADTFGLRLAATLENNGGWIDRPDAGKSDVNGNDLVDVRLKSLWQVSDAFDIKATVIVSRNSDDDSGGLSHSDADGNFAMPVDRQRDAEFRDDYDLLNLTLNYDFGGVNLLSSSSYINHEAEFLYTLIGGPETLFNTYENLYDYDQQVQVFSQEIRLASDDQGALTWTTGVFLQDVDESSDYVLDSSFFGTVFPSSTDVAERDSTSWAAFADVTYSLTERWKIGLGARYFEDEREVIELAGRQSGTFDKVTWRVNSSYAFRDNIRGYVSVATGFRSGGFSSFGFPPYDPEMLTSYEAGVKMMLPEQRTHLDFAAFRSDYEDYLRSGLILNPITNVFVGADSNIGDVKIEGAELSLSTALTDALTLAFTGAYTESTLERLNPRAGGISGDGLGRSGDPIDYIPKFSYTAGLNYDFSWGDNIPGFARVDYSYRDRVSVTNRGATASIMYSDDTALLDARLGVEFAQWSLQFFGQNLTNENGSFDPWIYWGQAVRNRPRTYGLKLSYDF